MATYRKQHITRWRNGWRYKRRVPKTMVPLIGATYWTKYLGAISEPDAVRAARKLDVHHDDLLARLEGMSAIERLELAANGGLKATEAGIAELEVALPFVEAIAKNYSEQDVDLDKSGPQQGIDVEGAEEWYDADPLEELRTIRASRTAGEAVRGKIASRRELVTKSRKSAGEAKLEALIDLWLKVSPPSNEKTQQKRRLYVRRFVACVGDLEPSKVTRQHIIKFRDALEAEGLTRTNIQTQLTGLNTLFKTAVSEGVLDTNPADGVRVAKRAGEKFSSRRKKPFTGEQVAAILKASEHHDFGEGSRKRIPSGRADDMRWIIKLLAYHGARSGEIVQLRPEDVTTIAGIPVLRLTDEDGSVKTANALREIPIHPECMEIVARAAALKDEARLFMSLAGAKDAAHTFQHEASKFLKDVAKIDDAKLTLHSLRHTWRTVAREVEMPDAVSKAIMGHSTGSDVHANYGSLPSLKKRAEWIARVDPLKG